MARVVIAGGLALAVGLASGCQPYYDVDVGTPVPAAIDTSAFDRVFVAGFVSDGGVVDTNEETVRLLRSQLRIKSHLRVADAEPLALDQERLQDAVYWKRVGDEYPRALIVTGSVTLAHQRESRTPTGFAPPPRRADPVMNRGDAMVILDRQRFTLQAVFLFIDGASGATLHRRPLRLDVVYNGAENVPALSAYFDLMDRLLPRVLSIVSDQTFYGTRTLLK
jgi:hypothetical protein